LSVEHPKDAKELFAPLGVAVKQFVCQKIVLLPGEFLCIMPAVGSGIALGASIETVTKDAVHRGQNQAACSLAALGFS